MHNYPVKHVTPGMNFGFSPLMCSPFSCDTCEFSREFPAGAPSWEEGQLEQYALSPVDLVAVHLQGQQRGFAVEREGAALWKSGCHAIPCECSTLWLEAWKRILRQISTGLGYSSTPRLRELASW